MLLQFGGVPTLVISSTEMAREITKTHDIAFANRPFTTGARMLFYGCADVAFRPYGDYWQKIRKISVAKLLGTKRVQSFKSIREEEVALVIQKICDSSFQGHQIKLCEFVASLSNNIICRCTLGRRHEAKDGENKFPELTRQFTQLLGAFSFGDLYPCLQWMDGLTGLLGKRKRVSRELDAFLDEIIDQHAIRREYHALDDDKISWCIFSIMSLCGDLVVTGNSERLFTYFKGTMFDEFVMTHNGLMSFLGMQIDQDQDGIFLCQQKYTEQLLEKYKMKDSNIVTTPVTTGFHLTRGGAGKIVDSTLYKSDWEPSISNHRTTRYHLWSWYSEPLY